VSTPATEPAPAPAPRPLVGEAGRAELRRLLPTGGLKALPAFQTAQALRIPGVDAAAFDALHACGVTRLTAHAAIFQRLAQSLLEQAATAPRDRLLALLAQAFPYISVDVRAVFG
jgi:hypothetical protein